MPTYKELLMSRDAFRELRQRIDWALTGDEIGSPLSVEFDEDTGDVLITGTYDGVERTHRLIIKDENAVPTLPSVIQPPDGMPCMIVAMLQATIEEAWQQYGGAPTSAEQFWNHLVGNGAADVPRETSGEQ